MTDEMIAAWMRDIDKMSHEDLARLFRFAPLNHPVFSQEALYGRFCERFKACGMMTQEMSEKLSPIDPVHMQRIPEIGIADQGKKG